MTAFATVFGKDDVNKVLNNKFAEHASSIVVTTQGNEFLINLVNSPVVKYCIFVNDPSGSTSVQAVTKEELMSKVLAEVESLTLWAMFVSGNTMLVTK